MKNLLIAVVLGLVLFSCKHDAPTPPSYTIALSPTLRDYGYFLPGTYWVYEDSASHSLDSVYVLSASTGTNSVTKQQNLGYVGTFGWFKMQLFGTRQAETDNEWVDMTYSMNFPAAVLWRNKTVNGNFIGENFLMTDDFNTQFSTAAPREPNGSIGIVNAFDTLRVLNTVFKTVVEMYDKKNSCEGNNRSNVYISKHTGVIRKELLDSNKVWNLKRYHIVQ
ncbi:MAG TPA: hypothetical protein VGO45_14345 [Bacteroidia bacterium]|jgi:hypothetical protein|nr:hypothetical protein [Bacteroidia bacterium]